MPPLFRLLNTFRRKRKRILIIKTDAIGDYILFRNFLEIVSESERFKDHEIDLLGNSLWQDVAIKYDKPFINTFFFTRHYDLYEAPWQFLKLAWQLFKRNYAIVLQPSSTRLLITDGLAAVTGASQIIGFESDTEGIQLRYKVKTDRFYTQRLTLPVPVYFEFDRHRYFFEQVLDKQLQISGPYIKSVGNISRKGIVVFPGAGINKRGWQPEHFKSIITRLRQETSQNIILAGGPAEKAIGEYLTTNLPNVNVTNLIGQTTLPQLIGIISSAVLVISNETSAIHIAAATATPCVCVLGGGHYGRFAPYPNAMPNAPVCVYHAMDCFNCNWNCIYKTREDDPYPCVGNVDLDNVWIITKSILNKLTGGQ